MMRLSLKEIKDVEGLDAKTIWEFIKGRYGRDAFLYEDDVMNDTNAVEIIEKIKKEMNL